VLAAVALAVLLALLPAVLGPYGVSVATEMLIFALFAASLHLIMGPGGLISFGHAAYFGLGAYGAALAVTWLDWPLPLAIAAGVALALAGAAVFAGLALRLTGVYLAMLTLAFAQIVWSTAFQWYDVTGGDNGLLGIWPPRWLSDPAAYYWFCLALGALALAATWSVVFSPFGYQLRAVRDAPARAAALGIPPRRRQRQAFVAAGGLAGLAGALFAFHKGSVFPDLLAIPQSVDALVMVLLGGLHSLTGPVFGAALWTFAKIGLVSATDHWRGLLGLIIIGLCIALPGGLATLREIFARRPA
jgi:branched-chain amino acid transport system permease protein